jgi:hypothetical protein
MLLEIWDATWRVPNAPMFIIGLAILGWALGSGFLAFTGSQKSGQPEIHSPRRAPEMVEEPEDTPGDA